MIASANCNVCYDRSGKHLLSAAPENVSVWIVKQAVLVSAIAGLRHPPEMMRAAVQASRRSTAAAACRRPPPLPSCRQCDAACSPPLSLPLQVKMLVPVMSQWGKVSGEVTQTAASTAANQIAVGHADGTTVRQPRGWQLAPAEVCLCACRGQV